MRKIFKKILCTLLVVVMCLTSAPLGGFVGIELPDLSVWFADKASAANELEATGQCGDDVYWNYDSATGELVINGTGKMWDYEYNLPNRSSFYNTSIKSVVIEDGVTSIGECSFYYSQLSDITISESVTSIGTGAFACCSELENIIISNGVKKIGINVFASCYSLKTVAIGDNVETIGNYAFQNCYNLNSIVIPDKVNNMGEKTFMGCENLSTVVIGDSLMSIGEATFQDCKNLVNVDIGSSVTTIGANAFRKCDGLKSVVIPDNVVTIEMYAFYWCEGLTSVTIGNGVKTIGVGAFSACKNLTELSLGDGLVNIGSSAFQNCKMESLIIPDSVVTIGDGAFRYCNSITNISLGKNVATIGKEAFESCSGVSNLILPESVKIISEKAFIGCYKLVSIHIPENVTFIGEQAFKNCGNLENITVDKDNKKYSCDEYGVLFDKIKTELIQYPMGNKRTSYTIPNGVKKVGDYSFYKYINGKLTEVIIPESVDKIGDYGFNGLNIDHLIIPDGVSYIGEWAFACCFNLTNIVIPASVTYIGNYVFSYCINLNSISVDKNNIYYSSDEDGVLFNIDKSVLIQYPLATNRTTYQIPTGIKNVGCGAFSGCKNLINVSVANTVEIIEDDAFEGCDALKNITLGGKVSKIGVQAFNACNNLANVYYYGDIQQWNNIDFTIYNQCLLNANIIFLNDNDEHIPGEWEVTLEATYDNEGKKVVRCITCGEILEEESIPKLISKELIDLDTGVVVDLGTGMYNGKVDIIVNKSADENAFNLVHTATGAVKSDIYDINLTIDGVISQPKGYVTVKIPVPNGYNPNRCFIYYINTKNGSAEKIPTRYEDGYLVFETNHFSYYAVVEIDNTDNVDCSCNCHKGGIKGFFFKLILFFQKIFKSNKECKCGINHY